VLLALRRLLRPAPPVEMLYQTAAALGSDVPFFLVGGTAVAVGRGEEVYPLADLPRLWILLLLPAIHVSTAEAYAEIGDSRRALTARNSRNMIEVFCSRVSVPADSRTPHVTLPFQNDFEEAVFRRFPRLNEWKKHLIRAGASPALMSGSGSALFGVFPDRRTALQVRDSFGKFPGKALVVRGISRKAYHALWNR
jgi:4-diphosphocytidyl-2-C-methyl-D-erythritol kinase